MNIRLVREAYLVASRDPQYFLLVSMLTGESAKIFKHLELVGLGDNSWDRELKLRRAVKEKMGFSWDSDAERFIERILCPNLLNWLRRWAFDRTISSGQVFDLTGFEPRPAVLMSSRTAHEEAAIASALANLHRATRG